MEDLYINPKITIPSEYLTVSFSRSSGPGGQHVNKLNTRVSVFLDIRNCPCLSEQQKHQLAAALKGRVDKQGVFQVSSQSKCSPSADGGVDRSGAETKTNPKKNACPKTGC